MPNMVPNIEEKQLCANTLVFVSISCGMSCQFFVHFWCRFLTASFEVIVLKKGGKKNSWGIAAIGFCVSKHVCICGDSSVKSMLLLSVWWVARTNCNLLACLVHLLHSQTVYLYAWKAGLFLLAGAKSKISMRKSVSNMLFRFRFYK